MADARDEVLEAIDGLIGALHENTRRNYEAVRRAEEIKRMRLGGRSYSDISEQGALLAETTRQNLENLFEYGSRFRRAEARALYEEGRTMDEIATRFGVTRQRISALLKASSVTGTPAGR